MHTLKAKGPATLSQVEGLGDKVSALQGQLAKLEGDDLLAVLESATMCSSLAAVLSRPYSATEPDEAALPVAASSESAGPTISLNGSSTAIAAPAEAQPPLLLGAP